MESKSENETESYLSGNGMRFGRDLHPANDVWAEGSPMDDRLRSDEGRPLTLGRGTTAALGRGTTCRLMIYDCRLSIERHWAERA